MVKVGIIGAAGYTAGELIRILINHPQAELCLLQSDSQAGKQVSEIHTDLIGEIDLNFTNKLIDPEVELYFLCKGHGESTKLLEEHPALLERMIIDLSHDFRYAGELGFIYGLPELYRENIKKANRVANPGCFATAIQLGLIPSAKEDYIKNEVHISGITGSTGAGQSLSETSHFSWRSNNASVYKPFIHQHLREISQSLKKANSVFQQDLNFIPYRGAFTRGIIVTSYFDAEVEEYTLIDAYYSFYREHPFIHITDSNPDLKRVVNTNKCVLYPKVIHGKAMVISVIDNLIKGASGQAVQNMNLMLGFKEYEGLQLKSTLF